MELKDLRAIARGRWGRATPFRLGLIVGNRGLEIECPYPRLGTARLYREGVAQGSQYSMWED